MVELTSTYTMEDWRKASEGKIQLIESEGPLDTGIISIRLIDKALPFKREDFEVALKKVSRRIKK